jgi:uncharacterized protein (TIGR02302 family)
MAIRHDMNRVAPRVNNLASRFAKLTRRAGRALIVERAWPPFVAALAVVILFLAASWLGVWTLSPRWARIAGVALFGAGFLVTIAPLVRLRWPRASDIAARLDRDSGRTHRPATSLADDLANAEDPLSRALWAAHQARLADAVNGVRVATPAPRMVERDPYALRFGVAMMALAAAIAAGPETYARLAAAFDWRAGDPALAAAASRIDMWIDPPAYTGRPPVVVDVGSGAPQTLTAFEDSVLVVKGEQGAVETKAEGALVPDASPAKPLAGAPVERRWSIRGDGRALVRRDGRTVADVILKVVPTNAPVVTLTKDPQANLSGSLTLAYRIEDRYGVTGARADFALPADASKPAQRTLAEPPKAGLETSGKTAEEDTATVDLSEHPWAGAKVTMTITATSVSGKSGRSAPLEIALPERPFHNPLARALVEERRSLVLDPDHAPKRVSAALGGLIVAPELFDTKAPVYLGLKQARAALDGARTDADLLDVAQLLWTIALKIEDGDSTQAQRDLRAAEQALRDALKRGASDDEIKKLMKALREAANRYAAEMAMKAERNGDQTERESNQQVQSLDKLMDRMEETARNGSREEAQAMLDQLENMFENMESASEEQQSPAERALKKQIDDLGKLMRDQQALRDDTFHSDQRDEARRKGSRRPPPNGGSEPQQNEGGESGNDQGDKSATGPDDGDNDAAGLGGRQKDLSDRLAEMQRALKSLGLKGEKGFDDAQSDMKEAEGDLERPGDGQGKPGSSRRSAKGAAVDAQGRALEALREGATGLQKQMSGQGQNGQGRYQARRGRPGEREGDDFFGRDRDGNRGSEYGSLREMGGGAERARRVMEELRRRLADPNRPPEERDYLERLMK